MPGGFFSQSEIDRLAETSGGPRCSSCGLSRGIQSPRMAVTGQGRKRILVVAEAPGSEEDVQGTQLVGPTGRLLRKELRRLDVDLDRDCFRTNAVICYPNGKQLTAKHVKDCRYHLLRTIRELKPEVILLLGGKAVASLIGWLWGEAPGKMERWAGWKIPSQRLNAWICPTWHPAYLLRERDAVLDLWFRRHLKAAVALSGRPWHDGPPDYPSQVERLYDPVRASERVLGMVGGEGPIAFDFETDRLKPDHPDASIISCSVSDGKTTIAFPWVGEAIPSMGKLLRSDRPKIAANMKFEERWTRRVFGHGVRNWAWDTMQAAHILDNRRGVSGLKFQAFVYFGVGEYDNEVKNYIEGEGGNGPNRMREVKMADLLLYNGLDSLLEWKLAKVQRKELQ